RRHPGVVLDAELPSVTGQPCSFTSEGVLPRGNSLRRVRRARATKAEMVGAGGSFAFASAAYQIPAAILAGAQGRSATQNFFLLVRFAGIEGSSRSTRIARYSALCC